MTHYVCKGDCKTVSDSPGICLSDFCKNSGKGLEACDCEDGEHAEAGKSSEMKKGDEQ